MDGSSRSGSLLLACAVLSMVPMLFHLLAGAPDQLLVVLYALAAFLACIFAVFADAWEPRRTAGDEEPGRLELGSGPVSAFAVETARTIPSSEFLQQPERKLKTRNKLS
jgi:hypothetical protein